MESETVFRSSRGSLERAIAVMHGGIDPDHLRGAA